MTRPKNHDRLPVPPRAPPPAPPEPVDLSSQSVAGEEDPGAGIDAPAPNPLDEAALQSHRGTAPKDDTRSG